LISFSFLFKKIFVDGPSKQKKHKKHEKYFVAGIRNIGNSCYINSILQVLIYDFKKIFKISNKSYLIGFYFG